ncbi:MAG: sigma-70 family RNA polymerase sigma factor [Psychroflexus sp.]|nr:sigma-70 family RNA polymerase sigma factor [Psychroflexus sp.]MDN6309985.1 sigma-70 family RNA polymerase sigma factor [Psychroflexus sp.]
MNEKVLLIKIKKGDQTAFKRFFNKHYQPICIYLQSFKIDPDTAQEIAQSVFVKFWNKREDIFISSSAKAYLYRMAYNEYLMRKRKEDKEASLIDSLTYEALQDVVELSQEEFEHKCSQLKKSIDKLPQACREILRLKMNGATYKEIATELDISIKTVESQMRIAYIKLREDLKDVFLFIMAL